MVVRSAPGAGDIGPSLRNLMLELDPNLPLATNAPFRDLISMSLLPNRIAGLVAAIFGGTGLLLATVGLFGVLAFTVQRRRREIGVRMALGAGAERIRRMVVRDGLRLTSIGLVVGLILAAVVAQLLRGLLFGLSPLDPVTYGAIAVLMFGTALVACMEPVRRALRTEPLEVLRHD
jgi:ABC-type antimicrobial peptide transport system permease subunit